MKARLRGFPLSSVAMDTSLWLMGLGHPANQFSSSSINDEFKQFMHTLGCFDDGVDDDDDALLGDPESFRLFLSFTGESGPFSTLGGEFASCNQLAKAVLIS